MQKLIKQKYPRTELIIAGEGSRYSGLMNFINSENITGVTFYSEPNPAQLATLLAESDLILNTSFVDNSPPIIPRALSLGLPVIATDVGGIKELVKDGLNGFLVRSNDHVSVADRVIELIEDNDLFRRFSFNARESFSTVESNKRLKQWRTLLEIRNSD